MNITGKVIPLGQLLYFFGPAARAGHPRAILMLTELRRLQGQVP